MNKKNYSACIELLYSSENIVITTHMNPDGDAIGSALALYNFSKNLGKNVYIFIMESAVPENMKFLKNSNKIKRYIPELHNKIIYSADAIFMLDFNDISRIKTLGQVINASTAHKIMIDHHIGTDTTIADIYIVDPEAAATGELVYDFIKNVNGNITKDIAEDIYVALMTDTGNYRFNNVRQKVFEIAVDLIKKGVKPNKIYNNIYNKSINQIRLLGMVYSNMEVYFDGKLTFMTISDDMFVETGTEVSDIEGFADKTLLLKSAIVGILIIELKDKNELRISLRSNDDFNVRQIAVKYNGGGHINASGLRMNDVSIAQAKELLKEDVFNLFNKITI